MLRANPRELLEMDGYSGLRTAFGDCFRNRRVLITGATGFLGPYVVAAGLALGARMHVLAAGDGIPGVKSWPVRVEYRRAVSEVISSIRPEGVLHLAAAGVTYGGSAIAELLTVNVTGLDCVLAAISGVGPCPVVVAGSGFERSEERRVGEERRAR